LLRSTQLQLFIWLLSMVLVLTLIGTWLIQNQRIDFDKDARQAINHIHGKLLINDAALSGFGSLLNSVGSDNLQQTRDFTKRMRDAYPHIYMFEAMISVNPANKAQHEEQMRESGFKDYKIIQYVSDTHPAGRPIDMINGVPMHFPIFFVDPYLESVEGLMGFDMMSVKPMRETLLASLVSGEPTASKPYKLLEGGRGYVLIKALDTLATMGPVYSEGGLAVLLLIKTDTMLASAANIIPAASVQLLFGKERKLAAEEISAPTTSSPIIAIDTFIAERQLDDLGQPFTLSIQQPAGLYAQDLQYMVLIFIAMCIAYGIYYRILIAKYRLRLQRDTGLIELILANDEKELAWKEADRAKSLFISTVSHELRTPLTSIKGAIGMMKSGAFDKTPEKLPTFLNMAYQNTERLHYLIDDILDIERLNAGKMNFQMNETDLSELLKEAGLANEIYGKQYGVTFVCSGIDEPHLVNGDHHRLMQVMSNLLSNAAKFSSIGGKVEISVARHQGNLRVSVKDNGCGIPESARANIFDKFTQVDATDQPKKGGSGLGLCIAKMIVEAHDGYIDFISAVDKGTTFHFDLPELRVVSINRLGE
jgi:signal transduction histidine kinase